MFYAATGRALDPLKDQLTLSNGLLEMRKWWPEMAAQGQKVENDKSDARMYKRNTNGNIRIFGRVQRAPATKLTRHTLLRRHQKKTPQGPLQRKVNSATSATLNRSMVSYMYECRYSIFLQAPPYTTPKCALHVNCKTRSTCYRKDSGIVHSYVAQI